MRQDLIYYVNNLILKHASKIDYIVKNEAPNNETDLNNCGQLIIWNGESDNTIFQDPQVNYAFRALHDTLHLSTKIDFSPKSEIYLGRIQASQFDSSIVADLVYCEVSLQAEYFLKTGHFVCDQVAFTKLMLGL